MESMLRKMLREGGADVVGFASVKEALNEDISHLERAVSFGVSGNLRDNNLKRLKRLQKKSAKYLKKAGYRYLCIPPDSDRITNSFVSRLYPLFTHKIAATCAGIGWIGKNGLLISPTFGPRLSLATVLTDAPLRVDSPIEECLCETCSLCVDHCPSGAISGETWSRNEPFPNLIDIEKCKEYKENARSLNGKPNCGLCIHICPYGRTERVGKQEPLEDTQ